MTKQKNFTLIISDFLLRWIASFSVIQVPVTASRWRTSPTKKFSIEFMPPSNIEQAHSVGSKGGTINLFTLPTKNIDTLKERLEKTAFFVSYVEAPYASFLNVEDPMGNNICLYEPC